MGKSVRYKLNRSTTKPRRGKGGRQGKLKKKRFSFSLGKPIKIIFSILLISLLIYWLFVAYTTVRDIKVTDVVPEESEIVEFADQSRIRRTLVIYEKPHTTEERNLFLLAAIYNTETSQALIYHLPDTLYINDYFANKDISVEYLTYAGESYMYNEKYAYVIRQTEEQMAINFDSYVLFGSQISKNFVSDDDSWGKSKDDVLDIFSKLSFLNLMPRYYKVYLFEDYFHSNMSFLEMYTSFQNIRGIILSGNYEYFNLKNDEFVVQKSLGSGREIKVLNRSVFDESLRQNIDVLRTRDLRAEHVKVEVYNGSDIPGYARNVARRIFNSGCRVIRFENASKTYENTKIYVSDIEKFANGLSVVESIVDNAQVVEGRPEFLTTGDIIVVLGLDQ